jgi:L-serine dehydratase
LKRWGIVPMTLYSGLRQLGRLIRRLETNADEAVITILAHEFREEIARNVIEGLLDTVTGNRADNQIKIETSTGEYSDQIAFVHVHNNKYTLAKDHSGVFISNINYYACRITSDSRGVLVYHQDYPGVIHDVSRVLADHQINISTLHVSREQKGKKALLVSLTDEAISPKIIAMIEEIPQVYLVVPLH